MSDAGPARTAPPFAGSSVVDRIEVEWLGHAAVLVTTGDGVRVLFDPYESMGFDGRIAHAPICRRVDVVAITHHHKDHSHVTPELGGPYIVEDTCRVGALRFCAVPAFHDQERGQRMGMVRLIALETADGHRVVHLGDLGVPPTPAQVAQLGRPDLLVVPVGGTYTIDAAAAAETVERFAPRLVVPVHYRNEKCLLPMAGIGPFLDEARRRGWPVDETVRSTVTVPPEDGTRGGRIQVLTPSH